MDDSDFITSDKFLNASGSTFTYYKRDYIFRPGHWRGQTMYPLWLKPHKLFGKNLVLGHSDFKTELRVIKRLKFMGVKRLYGHNTLNWKNFSRSIPLGLTNDCDDGPIYRILGNSQHLKIASDNQKHLKNFDGTIYVNFNKSNNLRARGKLLDILRSLNSVKYDELRISEEGRIDYLRNLRKYSLVPCPEGNGIDTHRLWETLYMGGTPIVLKSDYLPEVLNTLPVILLDSWDNLTDMNFIEKKWNETRETLFDYSPLRQSYWIKKLSERS
jgi:hypothetical protein